DGGWGDGYGIYYDAGNLHFFVNNWSSYRVSVPIQLDEWQHIATTYSPAAGELRFYINGELAGSTPLNQAINHTSNDLFIGQGTGSTSYTWSGIVDEVGVYDQALSENQIAAHYVASFAEQRQTDISLLRDSDANFRYSIASSAPNTGEFQWAIPADGSVDPGTDYRIEVTRTDNPALTDVSDDTLEITAPITQYFVNIPNDADLSDNEYTTASGDDTNSGLSPASPKATIRSVLESFSLEAGDVILVDTGTYDLTVNVVVEADDSGVTIRGPVTGGHEAVLNRGNTSSGSYGIELLGGDDVTIENLSITGANSGVYIGEGSDSDRVTIRNNRLFDNLESGIFAGRDVVDVVVDNNEVFEHRNQGFLDAGIVLYFPINAVATNNRVYDNAIGILAEGAGASLIGNEVYDNSRHGIEVENSAVAIDNAVYGHVDIAIYMDQASVIGNLVYDNEIGIVTPSSSSHDNVIEDNRIFNNTLGIQEQGYDARISGNHVYSNLTGMTVSAFRSGFTKTIANNLIYANDNLGINLELQNSAFTYIAQLENNSIYQDTGDAIRVAAPDVDLRNNIVHAGDGYAIDVTNEGQFGFTSDYNLFTPSDGNNLARWGNQDVADLATWFYELGYDANGQQVGPQFVDFDGPDDTLDHFRRETLDDGETGFALTGDWTLALGDGYQGDYYVEIDDTDEEVASWTFEGLTPGDTFEMFVTFPFGNYSSEATYELIENGQVVSTTTTSQRFQSGNDATYDGVGWRRLVEFQASSDSVTLRLLSTGGTVVADAAYLHQLANGSDPADEDFRLLATSPAIDSGDPSGIFLAEPGPNGDRVNQGRYGNTIEATTS
ncbi:MAG: right-handed parallel beta-helix repeat-containing protein, partial [Planctomycetota bacterium]